MNVLATDFGVNDLTLLLRARTATPSSEGVEVPSGYGRCAERLCLAQLVTLQTRQEFSASGRSRHVPDRVVITQHGRRMVRKFVGAVWVDVAERLLITEKQRAKIPRIKTIADKFERGTPLGKLKDA